MHQLKTIEERRKYMLDMCQAVDDCCRQNGIDYSLAYGTLLGAHRHGGFIPWDDDFDIMMTRDNYEKFNKVFRDKRYKSINCFNCNEHFFGFGRIIDTETFNLMQPNIFGKRNRSLGISIDLYIVDYIPENFGEQKKLFKDIDKLVRARLFIGRVKNLFRKLGLIKNKFFFLSWLCRKQYLRSKSKNETKKAVCFAGGAANKIIYPVKVFEEYTDCKFEDRIFKSVTAYDEFLTKRYGDWHKLPPEDEREPYHGGDFYTER